jgi:GNAT superfamily N-acetyltransferase
MKYTIKKCNSLVKMQAIHKMAFADDSWPGNDHEFWVAYDEHGGVAGFASAVLMTTKVVFLSRSAVTMKHRGNGLHRQLIDVRMKWARDEGAILALTYIRKYNYASLVNLLRRDFHFAGRVQVAARNEDFHVMFKAMHGDARKLKPHMTKYINDMLEMD